MATMRVQQKKEYLTKEKHKELVDELDFLKTTRRKEVAEHLEYAKSLGDLSENAEYHEARNSQAEIEERIAHLESVLKNAEIVGPRQSDTIGIGSTVVVQKEKDPTPRTFSLVGSEESNMAAGKISDHSPLGAAMMGKRKGDSFSIVTPGGEAKYTIVSVQ